MISYLLSLTALAALILILSILRIIYYNYRISFGNYCLLFIFLFGYSVLIIKNYTSPDKNIFSNADYHDVEHLGFRFVNNKPIFLSSVQQKEQAIFPNYSGDLKIIPAKSGTANLICQNLITPVYASINTFGPDSIKYTSFELLNPVSVNDCSRGLVICVGAHTYKIIFDLEDIKPGLWNSCKRKYNQILNSSESHPRIEFINNGISIETDTCFKINRVNYGFPVSYFFRESKVSIGEDILDELSKYVLLRDTISGDQDKSNNSKLILQQIQKPETTLVSFFDLNKRPITFQISQEFKRPIENKDILYIGYKQKGGANSSEPVFQYNSHNNQIDLLLLNPQRFNLPDDSIVRKNKSLFIASETNAIANNDYSAGYYFNWFSDDPKNKNHCNAYFTFSSGQSKDTLSFNVNDQLNASLGQNKTWHVGNDTIELSTANKNLNWLIRFGNYKSSNWLTPKIIERTLMCLVIAFMILLGLLFYTNKQPDIFNPRLEPIIYSVILILVLIRLLLIWRETTFLPFGDTDYLTFKVLKNSHTFFYSLITPLIGFFVLRVLFLVINVRFLELFHNRFDRVTSLLFVWFDYKQNETRPQITCRYLLRACLIWITFYLINKELARTSQLIRAFCLLFPLVVYFINTYYLLPKNNEYKSSFYLHFKKRFALFIIFFGVYVIVDKGYSIIFLFANALYFIFESVLFRYSLRWKKTYAFRLILAFSIPIGILLFGIGSQIPLLAKNPIIKWMGGNTIYRAIVLYGDPEKYISDFSDNAPELHKIENAASNKWFIDYYYAIRSHDYFTLQPHMHSGVSYETQLADLLPTRYIIAEHGEWLLIILLFCFISISFLAFRGITIKTACTSISNLISLQLSLLIFSIALLVWLAATNRMVFFGQDFPLLTLNSKVTTGMVLLLFLGVIIFHEERDITGSQSAESYNRFNIIFSTSLLVTVLGYYIFHTKLFVTKYNLPHTIASLENKVKNLDNLLDDYQHTKGKGPLSLDSVLMGFGTTDDYKTFLQTIKQEDNFSFSVINRFFTNNVERRNINNLIHIISDNGKYQLAVNKHFFEMSSPSEKDSDWQGSLLAYNSHETYNFFYGKNKYTFSKDSISYLPLKNSEGSGIAFMPASYSVNSDKPILLIGRKNQFPGEWLEFPGMTDRDKKKLSTYFAYRLDNNDCFQVHFDDNHSEPKRIFAFVRYSESAYLAKNAWLNGRRALFYPMGKDFMWAYTMGNNLAISFRSPALKSKNYKSTIDIDLNKQVLSILNNAFAGVNEKDTIADISNVIFSVVALDGNGKVRLLMEHAPLLWGQTLDPNSEKDITAFLSMIDEDRNSSIERRILGHNSLLTNTYPGSTMKPFVYSSVMAGYNLDWEHLDYIDAIRGYTKEEREKLLLTDKKIKAGDNERLLYYAGDNVGVNGGIVLDAHKDLSPAQYIASSKNTYHSIIVFLGSFSAKSIELNRDSILLPQTSIQYKKEGFPYFKFSNQIYTFNKNYWPQNENHLYFADNTGILPDNLNKNYGVNLTREQLIQSEKLKTQLSGIDTNFNTNTHFFQYAMPENSWFLQNERGSKTKKASNGLKNTTVGADVYKIAPIKLAEMGIKLYTLNRNFRLTFNEEDSLTAYSPFIVNSSYGNSQSGSLEKLFNIYKNTVYLGMYNSAATKEGTTYNAKLVDDINAEKKHFYLYCKTGTANQNNDEFRHKSLIVIISKNKIHNSDVNLVGLKGNKVYAVYFSLMNHPGFIWHPKMAKAIKEIINTIIASDSFNKYMNE